MKTQLLTLTMAVTLSTYATPLLADDDDDSKGGPNVAPVSNPHAYQPGLMQAPSWQQLKANFSEEAAEVKGQIVAINDNLIIIKVSKVEHVQLNGNIVQADIQYAQIEDGNRASLHLNAVVEVEGGWDGNRLYAREVKFEDEYKDEEHLVENAATVAAKVKGQVLVINHNLVILTADKTEGFEPSINMTTADIQNAQFEDGYRADLRQNAVVEIEGRWDGKRLYASEVKFED